MAIWMLILICSSFRTIFVYWLVSGAVFRLGCDPLVGRWGALPSMLTVADQAARKGGWQIVQLDHNAFAKWPANLKRTRPVRKGGDLLKIYPWHPEWSFKSILWTTLTVYISMPGGAESIQDMLNPDPPVLWHSVPDLPTPYCIQVSGIGTHARVHSPFDVGNCCCRKANGDNKRRTLTCCVLHLISKLILVLWQRGI